MSFIQENKIIIDLGLTKEYKLVHFSDTHLITYNADFSEAELCKAKEKENAWYKVKVDFAIHFNEYHSKEHLIPSKECLDNLLNYSIDIKPDCILMSGDIVDYYSESNVYYLSKSLKKLNCRYLICCGNHDNEECYDFLCGGDREFYCCDFEEFVIVSLDNSEKHITLNQINKLKDVFGLNKPIILLMHIPIVTKYNLEEMKRFDSYFVIDYNICDNVTKKFIDIIVESELVKVILCGHVHGAHQSCFGENKLQICASSGLIGYINNITLK